jgi:tyrosyl-tRNA synthetase
MGLSTEERFALIKQNTEEIIGEEELKKLLKGGKKISVYIGTAITGKPHIGYFLWILKLADFLKAGLHVKILLADVHGALDNTPWNILAYRYQYYDESIRQMLKAAGADIKKLEVVKGSSYQLQKNYISDLLKLATFVSVHDAKKAASDVVKNVEGEQAKLSGLLYPLMQALDEEYLEVDMQYGGIDQRKIFVFARENLPKIGYKSRVEIMTPLIPSLVESGKMSASNEASKIDLLDSDDEIKNKINRAYCMEGDPHNGVMAFLKFVIMNILENKKNKFVVKRDKKFGGDVSYKSYIEIEKDFVSKKLHPMDLKQAVSEEIITLLKKIDKKKLEKLAEKAYEE